VWEKDLESSLASIERIFQALVASTLRNGLDNSKQSSWYFVTGSFVIWIIDDWHIKWTYSMVHV